MTYSRNPQAYSRLRRQILASAGAVALAACAWTAHAAEAPADAAMATAAADETLTEVLVTGSRVVRDGYDAPTPVNVLSADEINAAAPANISDFVNTLPSIAGSQTAATSSGGLSNGVAGIAALNLRALGAGRTLVLFDGQRSVASASTGLVDINTFPQSLISRVEVVTGGASSAYGSDAVGGVVNFILDTGYTGLKSTLEYGETGEHDNKGWKFNVTGGASFADKKGHVLFSAERVRQDGIHYKSRDWNESGWFAVRNPDTSAGAPFYIVSHNVGISAYTPGGLITAGPLRGTYFGPGGSVNQLNYGAVTGQWMIGGDWTYSSSGMNGTNSLAPDEDRDSVFGRVSYDITDDIEVFAQASYARYEGLSYYISPTQTGITIQADNAYLPASIKAQMATLGLRTLTMGTSNIDMPASGSANVRETERYVVGAKGAFAAAGVDVNWDGYFQHGVTDTTEQLTATWNNARLALATDAVVNPANGQIVCRSTLTSPSNGCVPLNRFGVGVASQAALDYVLGEPLRKQRFKQDVVAVNFRSNSLEGWAGPISIAVGAEHRKESLDGSVDPQFESGWKYGNYRVTRGSYKVTEGYAEILVPLMKGLDFNGAARYTDYSTSGGVKTWKAGLTWTPIEDVTLRASRSRDIRAANLSELYDSGTARSNSVSINGVSTAFVQNLQGNPNADPEVADGYGIGAVFRPRFLPGFGASIDFYDIKVDGVISFVAAQNVADYCYIQKVQSYCNQLVFVNGVLNTINLYYANLNSMKARGLDLEASYRVDLGDVSDKLKGDLSLRVQATHYIKNVTDDGVTAINLAGSNANSTPDWIYRLTALYKLDDWTFSLTGRGVSSGVISNAYTECTSGCPTLAAPYFTINDNHVDGALFWDLSVARKFQVEGVKGEGYVSIKNLFNKDPPLVANPASLGAENTVGYVQTNRTLYDVLGTVVRVGIRLEY